MSIIEQTLDKLERTASVVPYHDTSESYQLPMYRPTPIYGKYSSMFMLICGIILMLAFFFINQGVKLNISIPQQQSQPQLQPLQNITSPKKLIKQKNTIDTSVVQKTEPLLIPDSEEITAQTTELIATKVNVLPEKTQKFIPKVELPIATVVKSLIENKTQLINEPKPKAEKIIEIESYEPDVIEQTSIPDLANLIPQQIDMGNYEDVIDILNKYQGKLNNTWEYYYWQSQAYIGMGQIDNANSALDIGLRRNAKTALLWVQKGLILQEKNNHQAAIKIFKKAEFMRSRPVNLYLNLGYSAAVLGDFTLAKRAYTTYLKMTKNKPEHHTSVRNQVIEYMRQIN